MTGISHLKALIATQEDAQSNLDTLRTFAANGGQHRLTVSVEHKDDATRQAVEDVISSHMDMRQFLEVLIVRQEREVQRAIEAVASAAASFGREPAEELRAAE